MNIFDPHISGSLSVSGSGVISGNLTVLGTINATISGTTSNAISASEAPRYTLTSSFETFTGSYTTGSFTGSFKGDGGNLYNIPASGVTGLNLTQIADGSVTASVSNTNGLRVNSNTEITGALVISGSISLNGVPVGTGKLDETTFNTYTSSIDGYIDDTQALIDTLATTGSNIFKGTQTHSGSIVPSVDNTYDLGSPDYQWRDVYISSGSLYIDGTKVLSSTAQELTITTDNGQSLKILEGTTDSIVLQVADGDIELKSSADGDILLDPTNGKIMLKGPVEILNGQKIQSSVNGTPVVFANDIVVSGSIELTGTIDGIDLSSLSSSLNTRIGSIESSTTSLNSFTSSASGRLNTIETSTGSLNSFTSSINTTIKSKLDTEGVISGSSQITLSGTTGFSTVSASLSSLSSSISITNLNQDGRLTSIEGKTGSFATTGSNNFIGDQTITGSVVITQNLQVLGSSSFLYVTSSQLNVSSSTISVNIFEPAERFGGLKIYDSGSSSATASLLWDSLNNRFIYQNVDGASYNGSVLIGGPKNSGSLGDEPLLTSGKIVKSVSGDHIDNSIMSEVGGNTIAISGGLVITGSILSTVTPLVSGSSQITYSGLTSIPSGIISGSSQVISSLPSGTVSGSSQVLLSSGIWSGSAQLPSGIISGAAQLPSGVVSGSSQVLNGSGIWSGSAQLPGGVVSGSSQIDLTATTNYSSGIKTRLNAEGVISGSSQVLSGTGIWSGSAQLPSGTVSGSAQISLTSTTGFGTYLNQAVLTTSDVTYNSAVIGNMNISKSPYTDTIENKTSGGSVWLNYSHNGNVGLAYGGGNVGVGNISSISSKFTVYKGSQSNTVSIANSAAFIYGADIGLAIGQDSGAGGYGTWLQSMQTGGNSFPMIMNPNGGNVIVGSLTTSSYKFSVYGGQYGTQLKGGDLGTGSDILRLVDAAGSTKYLARGDGKHYFEGDTVVNGGDFKFNPGTGDLGSRYLYINKGASNDGGVLMLRDNVLDWQIINSTSSGNLSFYSYGTGGNPLVINKSTGLVTVNNGFTSNGIGIFNSTNDTQISLRSTDAWAGIEFDDSGIADYIWYNGGNQTFSIGGGGGNVSGKKLHVHGGMTIGSSYTATSVSTNGLTVEGIIRGASSFFAQSGSGFSIRNSGDTGSTGGFSRRGLWEGNSNYDPSLWAETGYGLYFYTNGSATVKASLSTVGNFSVTGTMSASNFSGSSSGTNTGDQTNISGNAATATNATNLVGLGIIQSTSTGTSYQNNYQVRENSGGGGNTNEIYAPQLAFHWSGVVASSIMMEASGRIAIRNNPGGSYENFIAASITSTGTLTETSSLRYKTNIKTIESGLDKVLQMRGVVYNRKDNGKEEIGVIAEEMNEILPQVIQYNTESEIDSVSYSRIVGVLIEAIKELKQEINELKNNG
jgi:hypothetical protein